MACGGEDMPEKSRARLTNVQDTVYLEQLGYLKEINDQQRVLSRTGSRVDQSFHTVQECNSLLERCKKDVEALKDERSMLMSRIQVIDTDLNELSGVCASLEKESASQCSVAPLEEYSSLLKNVNSLRIIGDLPLLKESRAYSEFAKYKMNKCVPSRKCSLRVLPMHVNASESKAGKSQKQCPGCFKLVSRNAISCPHCNSVCAKKFRK